MVENENIEDEVDYIYEYDEKGRRKLVRSLEANQRAYLRFTNKTSRPADVWWRDYRGAKCFYVRLEPGKHYDINSFITHPWEFTDSDTKEHYVINNKPIFRPPENIGGMMYRTNWNITISVRSLRQTSLLAVGRQLPNSSSVRYLELPYILADDLAQIMDALHRPPDPVPLD